MEQELKQTLEQMEKRLINHIDQKFNQLEKKLTDEIRNLFSVLTVKQEAEIKRRLDAIEFWDSMREDRQFDLRLTAIEKVLNIATPPRS
jgi:hypothetical protein